jgi:hypothetical protein
MELKFGSAAPLDDAVGCAMITHFPLNLICGMCLEAVFPSYLVWSELCVHLRLGAVDDQHWCEMVTPTRANTRTPLSPHHTKHSSGTSSSWWRSYCACLLRCAVLLDATISVESDLIELALAQLRNSRIIGHHAY